MKSKSEIVLKALLHGLVVTINGSEYVLGDDNELCVQTKFYTPIANDTDTVHKGLYGYKYLKTEYTVRQFINLCGRLSDDDVFIISADTALNDMKREEARESKEDIEVDINNPLS